MSTPDGYSQIIATFGNPSNADGSLNHAWYHASIVTVAPPAGWRLYYQAGANTLTPVNGISMHYLLKDVYLQVMQSIWAYAVQQIGGSPADDAVRNWLHALRLDITGGGFNYRPSTGDPTKLSLHSYGIAIDWDPLHNPHKKPMVQSLPNWWYDLWSQKGWSDGRHFNTPDPMHVQFATGA